MSTLVRYSGRRRKDGPTQPLQLKAKAGAGISILERMGCPGDRIQQQLQFLSEEDITPEERVRLTQRSENVIRHRLGKPVKRWIMHVLKHRAPKTPRSEKGQERKQWDDYVGSLYANIRNMKNKLEEFNSQAELLLD